MITSQPGVRSDFCSVGNLSASETKISNSDMLINMQIITNIDLVENSIVGNNFLCQLVLADVMKFSF